MRDRNAKAATLLAWIVALVLSSSCGAENAPVIERLSLMRMPSFERGHVNLRSSEPVTLDGLAAPLVPDDGGAYASGVGSPMTSKGPVSPSPFAPPAVASSSLPSVADLFASPLTPLAPSVGAYPSLIDDGGASGHVASSFPAVDDGGAAPQLQALEVNSLSSSMAPQTEAPSGALQGAVGSVTQPTLQAKAEVTAASDRFRASASEYEAAGVARTSEQKAQLQAASQTQASGTLYKAAATVDTTAEVELRRRQQQHLLHQQTIQQQLRQRIASQLDSGARVNAVSSSSSSSNSAQPSRCHSRILEGRQQEAISLPNNTLPEPNCTDPTPRELEPGVTAKLCNGLPCTEVLKPVSELHPVRSVHELDIDHDPLCKIPDYAKVNEHCRHRGPLGRINSPSGGSSDLPPAAGPVGRLNDGADPRSAYAFVDHLPAGPSPIGRLGYVRNISSQALSSGWVSPVYRANPESDDDEEEPQESQFPPQPPRPNDPIGRRPTDPALRLDHAVRKNRSHSSQNRSEQNSTDPTDVDPNDAVKWTSLARVMHAIDEQKRQMRDNDPKLGFVHSDDLDIMNFAYSPYTRIAPLYKDGPDFNLNNALNHPEKLINDVGSSSSANSSALVNGTDADSDNNDTNPASGIVNSDRDPLYHGSPVLEDVKKDQFGQIIPKIGWLPGKQGLVSDVSNDEKVAAGFENWRKKLALVPKQLPSAAQDAGPTRILVGGKPQQSVEEWKAEQDEMKKEEQEREQELVNYTTLAAPFMQENGRVILDTIAGAKLETPSKYFSSHHNESEFAQDVDEETLNIISKSAAGASNYPREDGGPPKKRAASSAGSSPSSSARPDQDNEEDRELQAKHIQEKLAEMQRAQKRIQEQVVKTHVRLHNVGMMHIRQRMDHEYAPYEKWEGDEHSATKYLHTMASKMADEREGSPRGAETRGKPKSPLAGEADKQEQELKNLMDENDKKLVNKHQQFQQSILEMLQHMRKRQAQVELNIADTQRRIHLLPMQHIRRRITDEYQDWGPKPRRVNELARAGSPEKQAQFMHSLRSKLDPSLIGRQSNQLLQQMKALQARTLAMHKSILETQRKMQGLFVHDLKHKLFSKTSNADESDIV